MSGADGGVACGTRMPPPRRRSSCWLPQEAIQMRARTTLLVTALTLAASGAGGSVVAATPGPTPDEGLAGACNMTNSHAAFGMFTIAGSLGEPSRVRRRHDHRHPQH